MAIESADLDAPVAAGVRGTLAELRASLSAVFRNPGLRRLQIALAASLTGDWAYGIAVAVWAYGVGGPTAVGVWGAIRFVLMALTSPLGSYLADRLPRQRVLVGSDLLRMLLVVAATLCLYAGTSPWVVFVIATLVSLVGCVFRPAQMAWMPSLTDKPEELTAANGTSSTIESLAFFIGPAIGGALLAVSEVETVFLLNAATYVFSAVMVMRIRPARSADVPDAGRDGDDAPKPSLLAEVGAGFTTIGRDRNLTMVAVIMCAQTIIAGAMVVFALAWAVDILGTGPEGVGWIESVFGAGAIVGGLVAITRATKNCLASDLLVGTVLWSLPLLLVVLLPSPVTVFAAAILMGGGNPLVDTSFTTIIQRIAPARVLGRVFGAVEALYIGGMALGSAVMPLLIHQVGVRWGVGILAIVAAIPVAAYVQRGRALDGLLREPEGTPLLLAIPMFAPLSRAIVENLATRLVRESAPAGTVILRKGDESDRFLVIESGMVEVSDGEQVLRTEGPGDYFGEIGLLRDVPRTATITAITDTELFVLSRADFLGAVAGEESRMAADEIVARRLG